MLAVIPVRDGAVPAGAAETVAECGGRALVVGSAPSVEGLDGVATSVDLLELGPFAPARWADALAAVLEGATAGGGPGEAADVIVLPASPDGRDLAPRLAHRLGRPLLAGATVVTPTRALLARDGGLTLHDVPIGTPVVATLQPGVRGVAGTTGTAPDSRWVDALGHHPASPPAAADATVVEVSPPDAATMDLAEAPRIVGGGAGLDTPERLVELAAVAAALGASMGATRVVTDRGWVGHERQIGTTGVVVDPRLYVAFGVSGAVQHTAGLGAPDHVVSVNVDPHCPMMQMADLAVVSDANAVVHELERRLAGRA